MAKRNGKDANVLLAVDVGNTQTSLGAFSDGALLATWTLTTPERFTDDEAFETLLFAVFGTMASPPCEAAQRDDDLLVAAVRAEPLTADQLLAVAERLCDSGDPVVWMTQRLAAAEMAGEIERYPDGRYGPAS